MKNRTLSLLLLCCCCATGAAAGQLYGHGGYMPGTVVPVFSEGANLRAFPSITAPVMTRVGIGTSVTIRAIDTAAHQVGNYTEHWYRVRCPLRDGTTMFGYLWGGALAKAATTVPYRGTDALLLAGIAGTNRGDGGKEFAARVVSGGKIIAQTPFSGIETSFDDSGYFYYTMDAARIDTAGFSPALTVIRIGFTYEACDFANGDVLLFWDGARLGYGTTAVRAGNEFGNLAYTLIFPGDTGGQKNIVLVQYVTREYSDTEPPRIVREVTEQWTLDHERLILTLPPSD